MAIRVLVVDDSGFFRRRVTEILNADAELEVVGMAENGVQAVEQAAKLKPDVITMDIEMPVMDGISATRKIMAATPIPIIMFSSLTTEGAKSTLEALEAGALDYLPKRFEDIASDRNEAKQLLCKRVRDLGSKAHFQKPRATTAKVDSARAKQTIAPAPPAKVARASGHRIKLLAIGTSTGGPVALQKVLTALPGDFPVPILLIQHMPAAFTPAFASRLNQQCAIQVKEASDGESLSPGTALLAPGGKQMRLEGREGNARVRIEAGNPTETYKPCIDLTFSSIADVYAKATLAVVLTGMGSDGREGARKLQSLGSEIWAQDENSSIVYGMPAAIVGAGLAAKILDLGKVADEINRRI